MPVILTRDLPVTSDALNRLRATAWDGPQTGDWEAILARSLGWVCAMDDTHLVGFVNIAWDGGAHAFLLDTTVHRDWQRHGIGRALVREAARLARDRGAAWLHVDFEEELESFYTSCGFRHTAAGLLDLTGLDAGEASPASQQDDA